MRVAEDVQLGAGAAQLLVELDGADALGHLGEAARDRQLLPRQEVREADDVAAQRQREPCLVEPQHQPGRLELGHRPLAERVEAHAARPRVVPVKLARVPRVERQHGELRRELRGARVDAQLVAQLPQREQLGDRVGKPRRLVRVLPLWAEPQVVVARHVEDAAEALLERAQAVAHRDERVAHVARHDERVVLVGCARERVGPLPRARVVVVHVRHDEEARGRAPRVARARGDAALVARRVGLGERAQRGVAPLQQLGVARLVAQPVGVEPVRALDVAAAQARDAAARVGLAPRRLERDGALAGLQRLVPTAEHRQRRRAVGVQRRVRRREAQRLVVRLERRVEVVAQRAEGGGAARGLGVGRRLEGRVASRLGLGRRRAALGALAARAQHHREPLAQLVAVRLRLHAALVRRGRLVVPTQRKERVAHAREGAPPRRSQLERVLPVEQRLVEPAQLRVRRRAVRVERRQQLRRRRRRARLERRGEVGGLAERRRVVPQRLLMVGHAERGVAQSLDLLHLAPRALRRRVHLRRLRRRLLRGASTAGLLCLQPPPHLAAKLVLAEYAREIDTPLLQERLELANRPALQLVGGCRPLSHGNTGHRRVQQRVLMPWLAAVKCVLPVEGKRTGGCVACDFFGGFAGSASVGRRARRVERPLGWSCGRRRCGFHRWPLHAARLEEGGYLLLGPVLHHN